MLSHRFHKWSFGLITTAGGLIAAPYVLPLIKIGDAVDATNVINLCSTTRGGLTQAIEDALSNIPGIGPTLGTAGWGSSLASAAIGIGGILLGDYIHRHYDRKGAIQWGTIIKYASLTTSILIALPSILSGISMGISYIASVISGDNGLQAARNILGPTIGFSGTAHTSPTGLAGLLPHLFTCGRALLPMGAVWFANKQTGDTASTTTHCKMAQPCLPLRGQPCELTFRLFDRATGRPLEASELEVIHTRPLHTMIVDSSLRDYHHLHPTYDPARQCFVCKFTPSLQAHYTMWNDFTVKGEPTPTHTRTELSPLRGVSIPARIQHTSHIEADGVQVDIRPESPLRAGAHQTLTLDIRDHTGLPVTDLEPIMGAYAHLVAFSADGQHFLHTHPLGAEPASDAARGTSPLHFHVMPEVNGPTQFFLQIQRGGKIITIPFGQMVALKASHTHRIDNTGTAQFSVTRA